MRVSTPWVRWWAIVIASATPWPHRRRRAGRRVHVAPVVLALRMHERIAVHLGGRGGQEQRALGLREAERPMGAEGADLQRLDRQLEVVARRGGAGEVQHPVERPAQADVLRHVVAHEAEPGLATRRRRRRPPTR